MKEPKVYHEYEEEGFRIKLLSGYFSDEFPDHVWAEFYYIEGTQREEPVFLIDSHDKKTLSFCASVFWGAYRNGELHGVQTTAHTLIDMLHNLTDEEAYDAEQETT